MATTTRINNLKLNELTKEQMEAELAAGRINPNEFYLTPAAEKLSEFENDVGFITSIPKASSTALGGVKADVKIDTDTVPVHIGADSKMYVQKYPDVTNYESHISNSGVHVTSTDKSNLTTATQHANSNHAPSNAERNTIVGIQKNGTDLTINSSTRKVNVTVPTKTSELTNDSGYITSADIDTTQNHVHANKTVLDKINQTSLDSWNAVGNKADSGHKHAKADITDFPTMMPNPTPLTIQLNGGATEGTNKFTYDGSSAKSMNITKSSLGIGNVENKSSATIRSELTKENVTAALGYTPPTTDTNTTYSDFKGATATVAGGNGLVPAPTAGSQTKYLRADGTWQTPPDTNTVYTHPTTSGNKHIPSGGSTGQILRWSSDGTAAWGNDNNTTYNDFVKSGTGAKSGLVPAPSTTAGTTKYLCEDGTWKTPPDTNTVYTHPTTSGNKHIPSGGTSGQILRWASDGTASWSNENNTTYSNFKGATATVAGGNGLVPAPSAGEQAKYLRADGTWQTPPDTNTTYSDMKGASTTAAGTHGLVPAPSSGAANRYLRSDGAWSVPPDTDTKYTHPTTSGNKHIPSGGTSGQILRWSADGTAAWGTENNTTYGVAGSSLGLVKSGTDITVDVSGNVSVNDNSHNHTIANVTGLQTALDAKAPSSHGTHVSYGTTAPVAPGTATAGTAATVSRSDHRHPLQTTISGNAGSATKLQNGRKIGNATFDGSSDITLSQIGAAASSHIHVIDNVSGLRDFIDALTNEHAIYYELKDDDGNPILDDNGENILGKIVFQIAGDLLLKSADDSNGNVTIFI